MTSRSRFLLALLSVGALCLTPAMAQDTLDGPYSAVNGDNYGRARMDVTVGHWAAGMQKAWEVDVRAAGYDRGGGRTHPVFDAAGDIYWMTSISTPDQMQYVAKARASDGLLLWKSPVWLNGSPGEYGNGGVAVGQDAVYGFAGGAMFDYDLDLVDGWAVGAFDKTTGATLWLTDLDGDWDNNGVAEDFVDVDGELHPLLHNGKLYVVFLGMGGLAVTELDAATGAMLHYDIVDPGETGGGAGTLVYVEGIFSGGDDGLFMNMGHWGPPHSVWGIRVSAAGASQEWKSPGGKNAGRSHVIYNPSTKHIYAHTWWDDDWGSFGEGRGFGVYDAVTGAILGSMRAGNHGYYDTASLGWDDASAAVGEFNGRVIIYPVNPDGTVADVEIYTGDPGWREFQWFQQLLKMDAGDMNGVVLSNTFDGSNEVPPYPSKVVMLDMSEATAPLVVDDAGAYIDEVEVLDGPDFNNLTLRHTEDFDGSSGFVWTTGNATTQNPNWVDGGTAGPEIPEIVEDPTCLGDVNCDGAIDFGDINPFVLALANWPQWLATYPDCPPVNTDINGDGNFGGPLGFGDINPFVALLAGGGGQPIPCGDINRGLMLMLDPMAEGNFPAIRWYFNEVGWPNGANVIVLRWEQYRPDLLDDLWINPGDLPWGWEDDQDGYIYPAGPGGTNPRAKLTPGIWQTVELYIDQGGSPPTYEVYVDGEKDITKTPFELPLLTTVDSMYWDVTDTPWIAPMVPPFASWDLEANNHARSAIMGPDGKIYFFQSDNGKLIALEPVP